MNVPQILLQQSTPELANATSGFASSSGLIFPALVFLVYAVGILLAAQFVAPWLAKSSILGTLGTAVLWAISYAIKGGAAIAVLGLVAMPAYLALTVDASVRGAALRWVAYGVVGFVCLVAVGWLADRAVARYINAHPDVDSWSELWDFESEESELKDVATDGGKP